MGTQVVGRPQRGRWRKQPGEEGEEGDAGRRSGVVRGEEVGGGGGW